MKNNLKKLGRLWPLLVLFFLALIVLVFSVFSIFSSDSNTVSSTDAFISNTTPNVSSKETNNIIVTPSPAIPSDSTTPVVSPSASLSPAPVSVLETPSPSASTSVPTDTLSEVYPQYTTKIDNTVTEFSAQYDSVSDGNNSISNISALIIRKVNAERNRNGLAGLYYDDALYYPAMIRAREMPSSFSHTRPDGSECFTVFPEGYIFMGENLAEADNIISDEDFASGCVSFWMQSEGHRENILNSSYTHTAVGIFIDHGFMYAVQLFGTPY